MLSARYASIRPLVCFLTDFVSEAYSMRIGELPGDKFEVVHSILTLVEMAQVVLAVLKPQYRSVLFQADAVAVGI